MAAASCTVVLNGEIVRIFGGNRGTVRRMSERYLTMNREDFFKYHFRFADCCVFNLKVYTRYNKR